MQSDLGIFPANHPDESKNDCKDQQDVNKPAHRVPSEQAQGPQQQQYDRGDSEHGFSSDGRRGTKLLGFRSEPEGTHDRAYHAQLKIV